MDGKPYSYRGFMLDSARHYMPVESICRIIEAAALCGMNRFHWHLVDDQGWRVEIKRYPKLTEIGSNRSVSHFWNADPLENNCGYYTQEEIRAVVAFARKHGIEIVPEIEIPGHASAMLAAYPQFGCRRVTVDEKGEHIIEAPYEYHVETIAGVFPNLICAGRDDAVQFLKNILDEIVELFPGPEVHIGGDEAIKMHWRRCPDCQKRMREHGLKDENELQRWLVLEMGEYLAEKGKKTIVWNESLDGGLLPKHFIVEHWWGNDRDTADFLAAGGQVIRSDVEHYYISRPYFELDVRAAGQAPAVPKYAEKNSENLLGIECCLWAEQINNPERAAYMLFPRLATVALQAKQGGTLPDWDELCEYLRGKITEIEALGLRGAPEDVWVMSEAAIQADKKQQAELQLRPEMQSTWRICDGLLRQERLEKLLAAVHMPRPFALRVMDFAWAEIPEYCGIIPEQNGDGADVLAKQLWTAFENREKGVWEKLPQDIWEATMGCFSRFVGEHYRSTGTYAFDRDWWTTRQVEAKLFRIGELEYELLSDENGKLISLHIPSDAKLKAPLLNQSVEQARDFIKKWFPEWAGATIRCESWLLSPTLWELLPADAHIIHFQQAFDITKTFPDSDDAIVWVFQMTGRQKKEAVFSELPEKTTLQRNLKALLLAGRQAGAAEGVLARAFQ